jgi:UDP-N-acetylglucosamine transferase subunit ALG13
MIFVAVGTQLPFDRLIQTMDEWVAAGSNRQVMAQIADGNYLPEHLTWERSLAPLEFKKHLEDCELVVAHAGIGTILSALELGKPVIVLPRRASFGEHRNDHQLATAARFGSRRLVEVADDSGQLKSLLNRFEMPAESQRISSSASPELLQRLSGFIGQVAHERGKGRS